MFPNYTRLIGRFNLASHSRFLTITATIFLISFASCAESPIEAENLESLEKTHWEGYDEAKAYDKPTDFNRKLGALDTGANNGVWAEDSVKVIGDLQYAYSELLKRVCYRLSWVNLKIKYFAENAAAMIYPCDEGSLYCYVNPPEFNKVEWQTFDKNLDIEELKLDDVIRIDIAVMPDGYILFDSITISHDGIVPPGGVCEPSTTTESTTTTVPTTTLSTTTTTVGPITTPSTTTTTVDPTTTLSTTTEIPATEGSSDPPWHSTTFQPTTPTIPTTTTPTTTIGSTEAEVPETSEHPSTTTTTITTTKEGSTTTTTVGPITPPSTTSRTTITTTKKETTTITSPPAGSNDNDEGFTLKKILLYIALPAFILLLIALAAILCYCCCRAPSTPAPINPMHSQQPGKDLQSYNDQIENNYSNNSDKDLEAVSEADKHLDSIYDSNSNSNNSTDIYQQNSTLDDDPNSIDLGIVVENEMMAPENHTLNASVPPSPRPDTIQIFIQPPSPLPKVKNLAPSQPVEVSNLSPTDISPSSPSQPTQFDSSLDYSGPGRTNSSASLISKSPKYRGEYEKFKHLPRYYRRDAS